MPLELLQRVGGWFRLEDISGGHLVQSEYDLESMKETKRNALLWDIDKGVNNFSRMLHYQGARGYPLLFAWEVNLGMKNRMPITPAGNAALQSTFCTQPSRNTNAALFSRVSV